MRKVLVVMAALALLCSGGIAQAQFDITKLPGYEVVTSAVFDFGPGGWAGWSANIDGKVILGANIISGDSISEFSAFRPVGPGETTPFGYTYGANEYGFILQNALNGQNSGVQIELYYANATAFSAYTISKSATLNYSGTGSGGWSAPTGQFVTGGGFQFATPGASPASSQIALENSVWPHYTYGPNEQGWVVQNGGIASQADLYVISASPVPEPGTILAALTILGPAGLAFRRRRA